MFAGKRPRPVPPSQPQRFDPPPYPLGSPFIAGTSLDGSCRTALLKPRRPPWRGLVAVSDLDKWRHEQATHARHRGAVLGDVMKTPVDLGRVRLAAVNE